MTIGEKIKELRLEHGLSQEKLAEKLIVSRSAVAKWEADKGVPELDNLLRVSSVFDISIDELVGNTKGQDNKTELSNNIEYNFGNILYNIELQAWNDGVYGVYIIAEDADFLYYQKADKTKDIYGIISKKYISLVSSIKESKTEKPSRQEINRDFFCDKRVKIELAKKEGIIRGFFDFRDDDYRNVVIRSFEADEIVLQFGGTLNIGDITKIEILD